MAADAFQLGLVPRTEHDPRSRWDRMALPYLTPTGVVQIRYRCLLPHHDKGQDSGSCPKYLGEAGENVTLFNAHAVLRPSPVVFLTEGEMDAVAIERYLGLPAVGVPGVKAWARHPHWPRVFNGVARLIHPGDGDDAGDQFIETLRKDLPEVHHVRLPDGDDANTVLARDVTEFRARCGLG